VVERQLSFSTQRVTARALTPGIYIPAAASAVNRRSPERELCN